MATLRDQRSMTERQRQEDLLRQADLYDNPVCGFKRNPNSERPPCVRQVGHGGTHSYDDRKAGR